MLQLSLTSDSLNEQQIYDFGIYNLRQQLAPVHGVTFPTPAGGKYRQIMVDIDPDKLLAKGLTPNDVVNAVNVQNLTLPSGTAKIGDTQYIIHSNAIPGPSPTSTTSRSRSPIMRPYSSRTSVTCATARPCSRTSCARMADAPSC